MYYNCIIIVMFILELKNVHNTSALAFATVYNWVNEFKRGHISTCDAPRSRRSIEAVTQKSSKSTILF